MDRALEEATPPAEQHSENDKGKGKKGKNNGKGGKKGKKGGKGHHKGGKKGKKGGQGQGKGNEAWVDSLQFAILGSAQHLLGSAKAKGKASVRKNDVKRRKNYERRNDDWGGK